MVGIKGLDEILVIERIRLEVTAFNFKVFQLLSISPKKYWSGHFDLY